jgi:hypothetical protein
MPAPDLSRVTWRKSSYSNGMGGSCVEVAILAGHLENGDETAARDSKDPHGPALTFTARQWRDLTAAIKAYDFDV